MNEYYYVQYYRQRYLISYELQLDVIFDPKRRVYYMST